MNKLPYGLKELGLKEKDIFFDVMQKPTELALRVHIAKLKKRFKLEITNVKAIGYRLEKV